MPYLQRPCGARIYYETKGGGIPVLLLAPGGMRSSINQWKTHPYDAWRLLSKSGEEDDSKFHLIGLDQRFATERSVATVKKDDGWKTFLDDHLALLDHLKISKCHIVGSCIGPSYAFSLLKAAPQRFGRCVMLQPIGLAQHTTEPNDQWKGWNVDATWSWVSVWAKEMTAKKRCDDPTLLQGLHDNMFGPPRNFVFSVTKQDVAKVENQLLILEGKDSNHPAETSREIFRLAPHTQLIETWRDAGPEKLAEANEKIHSFLLADPLTE